MSSREFPGEDLKRSNRHSADMHDWPVLRRGRGRGGRLGRLFAHGDLHLLVLHLIARQPRHGYEIIKQIEILVGGEYTPSPGTIYPALTLLDDQGYVVVSQDERGKKIYTVTVSGAAYLSHHADAVRSMIETMVQVSRHGDHGPSPRIREAVGSLKAALHLRMEQAPLSPEAEERILQIIAQAVQAVQKA